MGYQATAFISDSTTDSYRKLGDNAYPYYTNSGKSSGTMYNIQSKGILM